MNVFQKCSLLSHSFACMWKFWSLFLFLFLKDVSGSNWFITFLYQMLLETNHFISYFRTTHKSDDLSSVVFIISMPKEFGLDWEDIK